MVDGEKLTFFLQANAILTSAGCIIECRYAANLATSTMPYISVRDVLHRYVEEETHRMLPQCDGIPTCCASCPWVTMGTLQQTSRVNSVTSLLV